MGKNIKITPTGGTINFSGANSTKISIDYNSSELNFNTHLGNDFKISGPTGTDLVLDNMEFVPSDSVKIQSGAELIDDLGNWKGYPMNLPGEDGEKGLRGTQGTQGIKPGNSQKGLKGFKGL